MKKKHLLRSILAIALCILMIGTVIAVGYTIYENVQGKKVVIDKDNNLPVVKPSNGSVSAPVTTENGLTVSDVTLKTNNDGVLAVIPQGTKLNDGVKEVTLTVKEIKDSQANIKLEANEEKVSYDIHIEGIANDNAAPIKVYVKEMLPSGLNMGNYSLYHVENGTTTAMTVVNGEATHNSFEYDAVTGDVTLYLASFSEVALVADTENAWNGTVATAFASGTGTEKDPFIIANADQLAYFSQVISNENDTYGNKHYKLVADVNLNGSEAQAEDNKDLMFYPVGYWAQGDGINAAGENIWYTYGGAFKGVFDGNGHKISNVYQNTWLMDGDYDNGYWDAAMGIFGYVYGGTIKNLTVDNFSSDGEFTPTGVIAAYAVNSTFENIAITNCNPRVYNTGNGGIVGIGGNSNDLDTYKLTFTNITIDNSNTISALWGSWDVACGGLVGMFRGAGHAYMTNCHVAAQIDVFNDVCGNYQYYWYRYAGMMIGTNKNMITDKDGYTVPETSKFHAENCTVHFGEWNDYYYCELVANSLASYTHDHQFSRLEQISSLDDIKSGDTWKKTGNFLLISGDTKTCYHIVKNADGTLKQHLHTDAGEETVNGETVLKENNQIVYLPFNQLFTGYGWGVKHIPVYNGEDYAFEGIEILDREIADSVVKFNKAETAKDSYTTGTTVTIGELFKAIQSEDLKFPAIKMDKVQVTVSPVGENSTAGGTFTANAEDWTQGTLTFTGVGAATITITDYYFCTPTTITVTIKDKEPVEKFDIVMNNGDFLHRVGNIGTVALDKLFKAKEGVTVGTISVTVEAVNGTSASGTYSNNAIQFNGTGVVKVTITDNDYCIPTTLYLEVVEAINATTATDATANNVVLLNNIGSGFTVSSNYTVFGNGFTLNYTGDGRYLNNGLKQGVVMVTNGGTLDNLHIKASIYPTAFMYYGSTMLGDYVQQDTNPRQVEDDRTRYYYQLSAVATYGDANIQNCYIYGGRNNIYVNTGNVNIENTVLECGVVANIQIQSTNEYTVTLENITTIQYQVKATIGDTSKVMLGAGVLVGPETTSNPAIVLNGEFKQYNWVNADNKDAVSSTIAKMIIQGALDATDYNHTVNGKTSSNLGIIYMNEAKVVITNNTNLPYVVGEVTMSVSGQEIKGQVCSLQGATTNQIYSDYENADRSTVNGDYIPRFDFNLGDQEISYDGSEDTRYLYGDKNGVTALYQDGTAALTLDLTKLATIYKYDGLNYTVTAVCKDSSGTELTATNGVITLDAQGSYTLEFTVTDNIFYNNKGEAITNSVAITYTVPLTLTVKEANVQNAVVSITKTALDGVYTTVNLTDYKLRINFLDAISVTDYDNTGKGTTVSLSSNIASATLTPASVNVFTTASTITITYTDGRVLTVNLSKISGSSPGTKTAKVNTSGGLYFITDGALDNKPTASSSQNTCTITSVSFKGNSGSTIINDTDVTVKWALGSSSGCFAEGTMITLADGTQKPIEQITYEDKLLAWDFNTGAYAVTVPSLIESHKAGEYRVINLSFADGTVARIIVDHGFFDVDENNFVYINEENVASYIGHNFVKVGKNGACESIELIGYDVTVENVSYYTIQTAVYNNCIAENMFTLTSPPEGVDGWFDYFEIGDGMKYDEAKMQEDIEKYGLYTYDDFKDYVTYEQFIAFNGPYLKVLVGRGVLTFEDILNLIATYVQ